MSKTATLLTDIPNPSPAHTDRPENQDQAVNGQSHEIGGGFEAISVRRDQFEGCMDPLIMGDHYTMTESAFGAHPHASLVTLSLISESSLNSDDRSLINEKKS